MKPLSAISRGFVSLALAMLLNGCENTVSLRAHVTVPAELTQGFSRSQPGIVTIDTRACGFRYWLAIICEPSDEDIELNWDCNGFGCAEETKVTARLLQANADEISMPCGIETTPSEPLSSQIVITEVETNYFDGKDGGLLGCKSGSDSVDLILK